MSHRTRRERGHVWFHYVIRSLIVLGSLAVVVSGQDNYFPLSNYPMYSRVFEPYPTARFFSLMARFEDGEYRPLRAWPYLRPFWLASYREALLVAPKGEVVHAKLEATLHWYNQQVDAKTGVKMRELRLFKHEIPWNRLVEHVSSRQELGPLYLEFSTLLTETSSETSP
ncbi:MAG: hypothetical protein RBT63_01970 [Bdellovibrionales bacterium]|nr:hypothetical protein [Bdellovibrionales bacterium]